MNRVFILTICKAGMMSPYIYTDLEDALDYAKYEFEFLRNDGFYDYHEYNDMKPCQWDVSYGSEADRLKGRQLMLEKVIKEINEEDCHYVWTMTSSQKEKSSPKIRDSFCTLMALKTATFF